MAVQHALRITCCSGCVTECAGTVFIDIGPIELIALPFHQCFVAVHILDRCLRHVLGRSHDDPSLHAGALWRNFFDERPEVWIQEYVLVLGVIDDVDNLLGKQSRINRVTNIAGAGARVIGLEMPIVVPSQRCDAIAT